MRSIIFIVLMVSGIVLHAQTFAPTGALWHYTQGTINPQVISFKTIESVTDTTINGMMCHKLIETERYFNTTSTTIHYMYELDGKVYFFSGGAFYLLYDFEAEINQTVTLGYYTTWDGNPLTMHIDSTSNLNINGHLRRVQYVTSGDGISISFGPMIIEGIGATSFMFPQGDLYINGPLRCYQDTALGLYKNQFYAGGGWSGNECDEIITGIEPADPLSKAISVYPVPAREKLYFNNLKEKAMVVISDLSGNIVIRTIVGPDGSIATGHLSPGMYILEIKTKNSLTRQKTIIQH